MSNIDDIKSIIKQQNVGHTIVELPGSGQKIHLKPLTMAEYKVFLKTAEGMSTDPTSDAFKFEEVFDNVLSKCITNIDEVDLKQLYTADWMYLMYMLRNISKGNIVIFNTKCTKCKSPISFDLDLNKLEPVPKNKATAEYKFNDSMTILLSAPRRQTEYDINNERDEYKLDSEYRFLKLASVIDKIEYKNDEMEHPSLVENLTLSQKRELIDTFNEHQVKDVERIVNDELDWGLPLKYELNCKKSGCNHKQEEMIIDVSDFFLV